jgi:soluble lytic murein transglycosylase-like protein
MQSQGMLPILVAALLVGSSAAAQQAPIGHRQPKISDLPPNVARREQASQPPQKGEQRPQSQGQASAAPAKGSGPPNIDIQKTCRESSSALLGLTDDPKQDLASCISDEQAAREQLTKDWANYPALAKSTCINPKEYLPGYVEWQSCIEMTRDVIKLRKDQAASAPADSHASGQSSGTSSKSRECPVVKTADDGSIDWVITNC